MSGKRDLGRFEHMLAARTSRDEDPVTALCVLCTELLEVAGAGLMLGSRDRSLGCVGVSDHVTGVVEQVEFTLGEGPCVTAYERKTPIFDTDLAGADTVQWTEFRRGALAAGIRAAFGFPLLVDQICIGALNLYNDHPGALAAEQIADAVAVAKLAGQTLLTWQTDAPPGMVAWQLERVPEHRMEVHQATGKVSVQAGVSPADALVLLRAYAYSENRSIQQVAADVVANILRFD